MRSTKNVTMRETAVTINEELFGETLRAAVRAQYVRLSGITSDVVGEDILVELTVGNEVFTDGRIVAYSLETCDLSGGALVALDYSTDSSGKESYRIVVVDISSDDDGLLVALPRQRVTLDRVDGFGDSKPYSSYCGSSRK